VLAELQQLFHYTRWANERVLDACAVPAPDEIHREIGGSFPSAWATLTHMYGAEQSWYARWQGTPEGRAPDFTGVNDIAGLRAKWCVHWDEQTPWLATLTEDALRRVIPIKFRNGLAFDQQLAATMRHVVNHSTYHRGQVTNFLRQLGAEAVATDLVYYYREFPPV
jgi:uncharacterized damage-inducible protein DinB